MPGWTRWTRWTRWSPVWTVKKCETVKPEESVSTTGRSGRRHLTFLPVFRFMYLFKLLETRVLPVYGTSEPRGAAAAPSSLSSAVAFARGARADRALEASCVFGGSSVSTALKIVDFSACKQQIFGIYA